METDEVESVKMADDMITDYFEMCGFRWNLVCVCVCSGILTCLYAYNSLCAWCRNLGRCKDKRALGSAHNLQKLC